MVFNKIKRGVSIVALSLFLASCVHLPLDKKYTGPKPLPEELKTKYSISETLENKINYKIIKKETKRDLTRYEIKIPPTKGDSWIKLMYNEQNKSGKHPAILIFPVLAGPYLEARILSWYYTNNGMNTIIVHRPEKDVLTSAAKEPEKLEELLEQMATDYSRIFDWAAQQEKIDSSRIGAIGVSLGGITLSTIAGLKQEVLVGDQNYPIYYFIALGGGPIADILKDSKESLVRKKWKNMKKASNLGDEELYKLLKDTIKTDPMNFAEYADSENIMMVVTLFDRAVPTKYQKELWKALGKPEVVFVPTGHYTAILYAPFMLPMSLDFFERKFSEDRTNKVGFLEEKAILFESGIKEHITKDGFLAYRIKFKDFLESNRVEARYGDTPSWTSEYLVAETLKYVMAQGDEKERIKERIKILTNSLHMLQKVTGIEGYVARAAIPERGAKEDKIWRTSKYGNYLWKGDTSKDQYAHLLFAYGTVYDLFDDEKIKAIIREDVGEIADHVLKNNLKIIGEQGTRTKHGDLNKRGGSGWKFLLDMLHAPFEALPFDANPFFDLEIGLNAALSLNIFKTAHHITGKDRFREAYENLIEQDYHKAVGEGLYRVPRWPNYSNDVLSFITIHQLLKYENNGDIRKYYERGLEKNWKNVKDYNNPFFTFLYYANNKTKAQGEEARRKIQHSTKNLLLVPQNASDDFIWKISQEEWFERKDSKWARIDFLVAYQLGRYYCFIE